MVQRSHPGMQRLLLLIDAEANSGDAEPHTIYLCHYICAAIIRKGWKPIYRLATDVAVHEYCLTLQ